MRKADYVSYKKVREFSLFLEETYELIKVFLVAFIPNLSSELTHSFVASSLFQGSRLSRRWVAESSNLRSWFAKAPTLVPRHRYIVGVVHITKL